MDNSDSGKDDSGKELRPVVAFMDSLLQEHGPTLRGVGWTSSEQQALRFGQFKPLLQGRADLSICDLGCGMGDLAPWLAASGIEFSQYVGVDASANMVREATTKHGGDRVSFVHGDEPPGVFDVVLACGIFNTKLQLSDSEWSDHVRRVVTQLAHHSRVGFGFNSLTSYVDFTAPHLFYADPAEWLSWVMDSITPRVQLLQDSSLYEFTLLAWHGPRR